MLLVKQILLMEKIGVKVWIYKGEILDKGGNSHVDAKKN